MDTCIGTDDDPGVTFYICGTVDGTQGTQGDACKSGKTERSDACIDTGGDLGTGSCSAVDWDCTGAGTEGDPGVLESATSSGLDSCDPDGPVVTFYICNAGDGSADDECVSADRACNADTTACTLPDTCALVPQGTDPPFPGDAGTCVPNNQECAFVTSSALCAFDVQPDKGMCVDGGVRTGEACDLVDNDPACTTGTCEQSGQYRLIYSPDVQNYPAYKLVSSNPGQTFYNLIVDGQPGDTVPVTMSIPYPYVSVGGQPVHVYDGSAVVGACVGGSSDGEGCLTDAECGGGICDTTCFAPGEAEQQFDAQWTIDDWVSGVATQDEIANTWTLDCPAVCGPNGSGACTLTVWVDIPGSGQAYVNVHLDYGLKGAGVDANPCPGAYSLCSDGSACTIDDDCAGIGDGVCQRDGTGADRYDQGSPNVGFTELGFDALVDNSTEDGPLAIADCTDYQFSHDDGTQVYDDSVQNLNAFKAIAGAFGVCVTGSGPCAEGLVVELRRGNLDPGGELVKSTVTDEDGAYALVYKHRGRPSPYTVFIYHPECGGGLAEPIELQGNGWSNVNFYQDTCQSESLYGKGRNKNV